MAWTILSKRSTEIKNDLASDRGWRFEVNGP